MADGDPTTEDPKTTELQPYFRERIKRIMARLEAQGYQPRISNAIRTPEQQAEKFAQGYAMSPDPGTHGAGVAADIIDRRYGWVDNKENAKFFAALTDEAIKEGVTAGGSFFGKDGTRLKPTHKSVWNKYGIGWDPAHIEMTTPAPQAARVERGAKMAKNPTMYTDEKMAQLKEQKGARSLYAVGEQGISMDMRPPAGIPSDVNLNQLNTLIGGLETRASIEEDVDTRNRLLSKIDDIKKYRLNFSGPHQSQSGTNIKVIDAQNIQNPLKFGEKSALTPPIVTKALPEPQAAATARLQSLITGPIATTTLGSRSQTTQNISGVPYPTAELGERKAAGEVMTEEQLKLANARRLRIEGLSQKRIDILDKADETINKFTGMAQADLGKLTGMIGGKPVMEMPPGAADEPGIAGPGGKPPVPVAKNGLIDQMEARFNTASKQLAEAREDIAKFKMDSGGVRLNVVIAGIADAMRTIGSSIASQGKNLGGGTSYVSQMIDYNMKVKQIELEKMMRLQGMTKEQRDFTWKAWGEFKDEKKTIDLRLAQLDAAKIANMSSRLDVRSAAAEEINKMGREVSALRYTTTRDQIDQEIAAKEKAGKKVTSKTYEEKDVVDPRFMAAIKASSSTTAGGRIIPAGTIRKLAEDRNVILSAELLASRIKNKNLTPLHSAFGIFGTDAGKLMPQIEAMARQIGRRMGTDVGALAQKEGEMMVDAIMGKDWNKSEQSYKRLMEVTRQLRRKYDEEVRKYGTAGYNTAGLQVPESEQLRSKLRGEATGE